ncbi:CRISPR-associated protein Csh1 [Desulfonauticus submarinus]|uniref:CRISPR-associated protein Csh1 n=1 Tax=Desulfonauticus submarinus TaxID=206665 RepID=A0A1H0DP87_9BACT|nr:TIGR02556 family CRISPR-associated protein [Desulfonauticus submarinus]SDN71888.1 CRISPR-associated protein Csh1 [Desulfonauticus submarinus]
MIEGVYKIGVLQEKRDFLQEFIEDPGNNIKHVFKIVVDISNETNPEYKGIKYEEYDSSKKLKYFYKRGSANGPDKTPTSKITQIEKTFNNKVKKVFKKYLKSNNRFLSEKEKNVISNLQNLIEKNCDKILEDLKNFSSKNGFLKKQDEIKDPSLITFVFFKNGNVSYVGELDLFVNVFKNNENEAYKSFYNKSNIESRASERYCYICGQVASEVWGFVNTYNFYTADKENYIAGGFNREYMWKNYPVCSECAKVLERGKKYINENLSYKFCGFNYLLIPELVIDNKGLLKEILFRTLKKYTDFSLAESKSALIEKVEKRTLRELAKVSNHVNFNFLFYEKSNSAFKILLYLREIAPTRLKFLIEAKDKVDNFERKIDIFKEIKKKGTINFNFSFNFIREFFPNSKRDGRFDNYFLAILNNIFIGKNISMDFLVGRFMEKIRTEFLNDNWIEPWVLKSYKIFIYLEQINVLDRRRQEMKNYQNNYEDFFQENPLFDDEVKKALFLEGVLAQKLLNIQYQERQATPFRSRLNGLKIDEKVAKRLLPEIINKLEEYNKNYYRELEETIGEYLIKSDFKKYSIDEMSYYFTLGMILAKYFSFDKEENKEQ